MALGGVAGPLVFVGTWALAGVTIDGYSPVNDAISDLAAAGTSTHAAMTAGFVVFGLGLIAFGLALRVALDRRAGSAGVATGVCTLGVAATPLGGWSGDTLHAIFAILGYLTIVALPLLASKPFADRGRRGWMVAAQLIAAVSALLLASSAVGPAHGLCQRLGLTVADIWVVATALSLTAAVGPFSNEPRQ
jgi:hypothetical membrane protein